MKKKILLSLFSSFFTILILEIFFTATNSFGDINATYRRRDLVWQENFVKLNSAGYRDKEYSKDRNEDTFRIYSLGDSYTFGWLVDYPQDSYPKILEKKLNKKLSKKVEVINAGTPGLSITEEVTRFKTEGIQYHPDMVLLALNDDEALVSRTYFKRKDHFIPEFIRELRVYNLFFGLIFTNISEKQNHNFLSNLYIDKNSKDWREFEKNVLLLKKEADRYGIGFGIIVYPHIHPSQPNNNYDLHEYNKKFEQFGNKNNIIIIDPLERFINYSSKEKLVVNPADPHPTGEMNKLVAEEFVRVFNYENFIKNYQRLIPKISDININKDTSSIGKYNFIRSIKADSESKNNFPWIYFEEKNNDSYIQEIPLTDLKFRNVNYAIDKMQIFKNELNTVGADILYYLKPQKKGEILLPDELYGYPVIGINNIYAIYVVKGNNFGDYIQPQNIIHKNNKYLISFKAGENYSLYKLNIKVGVRKIDIDKYGKIKNTRKTVLITKKIDKSSKNIEILCPQNIFAISDFFDGEKRFPYVFVDNNFKIAETAKIDGNKILLTFKEAIKKGQEIILYGVSDYKLSENEQLIIEAEEKNN